MSTRRFGWLTTVIRRWQETAPNRSQGQWDAVLGALAVSGMGLVPSLPPLQIASPTDEELCSAWCASLRALRAAPSRRKTLQLVERRAAYLDELERRYPAAFAAWLTSGAAAFESPITYLHKAYGEPPAINWDELVGGQD
jgi:hypothetical protein